jgi:hypothetical protein
MFRFFTLLALYAGLLACSESIPQISVQTELAGKEIQTTVDSDIARYYLEQFLKGDKTRPEYDRAIETAERNIVGELPSKALLQLLAQTHSTDFATLILWQSIVRNPSNRWPQKVFTEEFSRLKTNTGRDAARFLSAQHDYLIVFAPGWFYKSQPESGADFAKPRQVLTNVGARTRLLETEENGTVERNADLIAEQLIRFGRDAKKLIVVSASKAGPEVAFALTKLQQDTSAVHHVKAWVNIGGVLVEALVTVAHEAKQFRSHFERAEPLQGKSTWASQRFEMVESGSRAS